MDQIKNYVHNVSSEEQKKQLKKVKRISKVEDLMKSIVKDFINLPQHSRVKEKLKDVSVNDKFEKILQCDTDDIRQFIWFMINELSKQSISKSETEILLEILYENHVNLTSRNIYISNPINLN